MPSNFIDNLPFFLRSYIQEERWKGFREVQVKSFEVLFNTDNHLLISSGTSSGKTEAALFPVIADIYRTKPERISALYISPLIALIDDQFGRVSKMLEDSDIELFCWHGDISASMKTKVITKGKGILQITPESLEGIVNRNFDKVADVFSDLRYVIIDEVHTFMNSDRGLHLLCELGMIERIAGCHPRRIGLSATLSDFKLAKDWLKADTSREVSMVECDNSPNYRLGVTFDTLAPKKSKERQESLGRHYLKLFNATNAYNCIVFTNNRTNVENTVVSLKIVNRKKGVHKELWAHHSSISKEYRKIAEERMKDRDYKCTAVATSTLELGIDVGDLDRIVHINAPQSVSSFIQKFGRSGRRNGRPEMIVFCDNDRKNKLCEKIQFDLIKTIAEAELMFNDHWIEPIRHSRLPYSLLFQQTLSHIRSRYTSSFNELKREVLSLYPFREITEQDYIRILNYACENGILDYNRQSGHYCLDDRGDHLSRRFDFGSNFTTIRELDVYSGKTKIGTIQEIPHIGEIIQLAGSSWEVDKFDSKYNKVYVVKSTVSTETFWRSGKTDTHTRLIRKMYECLNSDETYPYLDESAEAVLEESRRAFREAGLERQLIQSDTAYRLHPWMGTVQFDTLFRILVKMGIADVAEPPFSIIIKEGTTAEQIQSAVDEFIDSYDPFDLIDDEDIKFSQNLGKYSKYIPTDILKKQFLADRIDMDFDIWIDRVI